MDVEKDPSLNSGIDDQTRFFLGQIQEGVSEPDKFRAESQRVIDELQSNPEDQGQMWAAVLLYEHGGTNLTDQQIEILRSFIAGKQQSSKDLYDYYINKSMLTREVTRYFEGRSAENGFWVPGRLAHPMANVLLNLDSRKLVTQIRSFFERKTHQDASENPNNHEILPRWVEPAPQWLVETFEDSNRNITGVWMSKKGEHHKPNPKLPS
jgi:hypothetical protein